MDTEQVGTYAALVAVSLSVGYLTGVRWRTRSASASQSRRPLGKAAPESPVSEGKLRNNEDEDSDAESDSSEEHHGEDLGAVSAGLLEECKLALVVRTDLGMSSGKIAAQCSHATLACYKALGKSNPNLLKRWERLGQSKVALRVASEEEMDTIDAMARSLNLCSRSIRDAGRTQIAAGSRTVLGIGPGPAKLVNQVTGKLRLL